MFKILIVEDERVIAEIMQEMLIKNGYECRIVDGFQDIMPEFLKFQPDIVLLDIILPFFDGYYWCGKIRLVSKVPILFVSSKSKDMDIIIASNMGGDDYLVKPFSMELLLAKVNNMIRRVYAYNDSTVDIITHKGLIMNLGSGVITYEEKNQELTTNEMKILELLLKNRENIVSREKIMRTLWEDESFIDDNTLTVNITRLRKKISLLGLDDFIKTKKGEGYLV